MLEWINDGNKYEEIWKAYFGSCEITILHFKETGTYLAYARNMPNAAAMCKSNYPASFTIEEVKEDIVEKLQNFLSERADYYTNMLMDLWKEVQWFDEEDE